MWQKLDRDITSMVQKNGKSFFNEFYQEIVIVEVKILSTCNFWSVFRDFLIEKSLLSDRSGKEVLNWKKKKTNIWFCGYNAYDS